MQTIYNICRLCLCQDETLLRPVTKTLDASLTIEDVERFTGIKINLKGTVSYALCFACIKRLKASVEYRKTCLDNDAQFRVLLDVLNASLKDVVSTKEGEESNPLESKRVSIGDDDDSDDDYEYEYHYEDEGGRAIDTAELDSSQDGYAFTSTIENSDSEDSYIEPADYSANYIEPCSEMARFDSDEYEPDDVSKSKSKSKTKEEPYKWSSSVPVNEKEKPQEPPEPREIVTKRTRNSFRPQVLCSLCGKLVTNISGHIMSVHKQERTHACPHCPVVMTHKGNLVKHIQSVHLKKVCKTCKLCGKGFTHGNSLITHMLSQHGIGDRHKCTMCPRQFNTKSALTDHMKRIHSNARPLECGICGRQFKVRRELVTHRRVHSDEQPFACSKCPKRFKSSYARKIHELTHTGVVFECELCNRSYRYKALLNMHMRKMHPDRTQETETDRSEEHLSWHCPTRQ